MAAQLVGMGFAILAAVSIAAQSLAVRRGTKTHSVSALIGVMFVVNLLVLIPITAITAYPRYDVTLTALGAFAIAGLLGSFVARLCYFVGIARLGASRAEPLKALFPLVAVGTAVIVLGEQVSPLRVLGVGVLILGGVVVGMEARASPVTATGRRLWRDTSFPLAAAVLLGIDPIFTKIGLAEGTSTFVGVTVRVLAAAAGFGLYVAWRKVREGDIQPIAVNRWLLVASVANTVYLLAYYAALARIPVAIVTPLLGVSTLFVVTGAAVFLQSDERVTWRLGGATTLIVIGVMLVARG